jgi:cardiolipin synthase
VIKILLLLLYFAGWTAIPHLLLLKKRPQATLAWLWAILFIPYVGTLAYLAIGTDRLKRKRLKRRLQYSTHKLRRGPQSTDAATDTLVRRLPRSDQEFLQLLSCIHRLPISSAEEIHLLRNSAQFYPALEKRIDEAQLHIHLEFYIWEDDQAGRRILNRLTQAAQRGVEVRLMLDEMGSRGFGEDTIREYRAAGGRFSWFQSLDPRRNRFFFNLRNHRKLQIVDGRIAFVGGMNIGRDYEGLNPNLGDWRDAQVEVRGRVATELQAVFADDWYFATEERLAAPGYFPSDFGPPRYPVHIVMGGPDCRNEPISKSFVSLLNLASQRAWIATGYFVPDDTLLNALELAAARGVDVRLLVSEKTDHPYLVTVGRSYYAELLAMGVRIFEYSAAINHAKIAIADDRWGMVGSANLDYRSMRLNFELNLLFHAPDQNAALALIFDEDFALCQEIEPAVFHRRPFRRKFFEAALRPLSPLL